MSLRSSDPSGYYPIVADYLADAEHHDIISTYDEFFDNVEIYVMLDEDDIPFVEVHDTDSGRCIVVENGQWYAASYD